MRRGSLRGRSRAGVLGKMLLHGLPQDERRWTCGPYRLAQERSQNRWSSQDLRQQGR